MLGDSSLCLSKTREELIKLSTIRWKLIKLARKKNDWFHSMKFHSWRTSLILRICEPLHCHATPTHLLALNARAQRTIAWDSSFRDLTHSKSAMQNVDNASNTIVSTFCYISALVASANHSSVGLPSINSHPQWNYFNQHFAMKLKSTTVIILSYMPWSILLNYILSIKSIVSYNRGDL